jgi:hypothetical protein
LGPLPTLHRVVVGALTLLACAGLGAWLAFKLPVPLLVPGGAVVGASLGVLATVLLLAHRPRDGRSERRGH